MTLPNLDVKFTKLLFIDRCRSIHHDIFRLSGLWKCVDLANVRLITENHHETIESECEPSVWRHTVLKSRIHCTELFLDLFLSFPDNLKCLDERFDVVIADRSRENFVSVAGKIVLCTVDREWIHISFECLYSSMRHGERIVFKIVRSIVFLFIHRKVCNPTKGDISFFHEFESVTTSKAHPSENFTRDFLFSCSEENHVSRLWCKFLRQRFEFVSREKFQNRRLRSVFFIDDICKSSRSE